MLVKLYKGAWGQSLLSLVVILSMGKTFPCLDSSHEEWIAKQQLFFVGTAAATGRINVSPKGYAKGVFRVVSPTQVVFLDLTGSGSETAAHLRVDGRICILFVALEGPPQLMRLHGTGREVPREQVPAEWTSRFDRRYVEDKGFRGVIAVDVERVSTSCGYSIPIFEFVKERETLLEHFGKMSKEQVQEYQILKNSFSIDGLPSISHRAMIGDAAPVVSRQDHGGYWYAQKGWSWTELYYSVQQHFHGSLPRDLLMLSIGAGLGMLLLHAATVPRSRQHA